MTGGASPLRAAATAKQITDLCSVDPGLKPQHVRSILDYDPRQLALRGVVRTEGQIADDLLSATGGQRTKLLGVSADYVAAVVEAERRAGAGK